MSLPGGQVFSSKSIAVRRSIASIDFRMPVAWGTVHFEQLAQTVPHASPSGVSLTEGWM